MDSDVFIIIVWFIALYPICFAGEKFPKFFSLGLLTGRTLEEGKKWIASPLSVRFQYWFYGGV